MSNKNTIMSVVLFKMFKNLEVINAKTPDYIKNTPISSKPVEQKNRIIFPASL